MEKVIKVGDFVSVIDDVHQGVVVKIANGIFSIDIDGFVYDYNRTDLVKIEKHLDNISLTTPKDFNMQSNKNKKSKNSSKTSSQSKNIIDLHIHHLTSSERGMTKHDKLLLQLSTAKTKIDDAINNKNSKLIIIHGVGKGVLKNELIKLFNSYSNIEYYDASFQDYGQGATEIKIYNN
jgi:dsDNA-specific endonuclease/ATPase MutS2